MSIWGKIIGGAAGFAVGGPLGALVGAGLGHAVVDSGLLRDAVKSADEGTRRITFTIGVIALAAKMAKADGQVTRDEVDAFKNIFRVPPHEVKNVGRVFDMARQDTAGYEAYAAQIAKLFVDDRNVLEELLGALFYIAKADGVIHPGEEEFLKNVAGIFGFSEDDFARIRGMHLGLDQSDPYTILGVPPDISDADLKKEYRKLVRDNHPDKMIADGMPQEFIEVANERLATINAAYDKVAARRGLN